jgi:hypothetical protein
MFGLRLQSHEVNHLDHADFQVSEVFAQNGHGGERL